MFPYENPLPPEKPSAAAESPLVTWDVAAGGLMGLVTEAAVGDFCCWYVGEPDVAWLGAVIGGGVGLVIGVFAGLRHGLVRRDGVDSTLGNMVCTLCSVPPALLVLCGGAGLVQGKFSGMLVAGAVCAFPMAAMLLGALFDRIYENILRAR